jgi:class 3 adenylate cyclase/predicted ATPase
VDVGAWLRGLGLERYEQAFRDNDVDAEVLPELTAEDLIGLGIGSIGHRRKLLATIAALRASEVPPSRSADVHPAPSPAMPPPAAGAERRQLTVMFADLVGSTALASRLDPEEMRDLLRGYQNTVAGEVARFGGHVAKFLGDGVLCYFGWPRADEHDAERAVRAGLAITAAVPAIRAPDGEPLAARVGIATGLVVVGELIGDGAAREEEVVGATPNLAARLQALAEPGTVVVAPATRRLVQGLFELDDLGPRVFKGIAEPVRAARVLRESAADSRFEARHTRALAPIVGRDHELALLLDRWRQAEAGEGQGVLLVGEAGIGKSRLVQALPDALGDRPHTPLRHQCSPYHADSTLWPLVRQLRQAAGLEPGETPERQLDKLEVLLARGTERPDRVAPLIVALLGIEPGGRYPSLGLTPRQQRARTLEALTDQLLGLARRRPVLCVFEDVHWADPTTLELVEQALDRIADAPVLMLLTSRPDRQPALSGHPHVTRLALNRLGRAPTEAMVAGLTGGRAIPREVLDHITARADGVPLFVEEMTKAVLEAAPLRAEGDGYALAGPLPALAVPASLHDSLMARLDRVPGVKEVAQAASCIGREFGHGLLAAVASLPEAELERALERLVAAELVFRRGATPEASYTFKHALVRDAAYASLLTSRRRELHARIAALLEQRWPETAAAQPEVLAHHHAEAGAVGRAVPYLLEAGRRALDRSALAEAVAHLGRGIGLISGLPPSHERSRTELEFREALGTAQMAHKGWPAPEVRAALEPARELCRALGETDRLVSVLWGLWFNAAVGADYPRAFRVVGEMLADGAGGRSALAVLGHCAAAVTCGWTGRFLEAGRHAEKVSELHDPAEHGSLVRLTNHDPQCTTLVWWSHDLWMLGYPDQAVRVFEQQLALARHHGHPFNLCHGLMYGAATFAYRREPERQLAYLDEAVALVAEYDLPWLFTVGSLWRAFAAYELGRIDEALALSRSGLASWGGASDRAMKPYRIALLALCLGHSGRPGEALAQIEDALDRAERTEDKGQLAELWRIKGELLLILDRPDEAEAERCFEEAIRVAVGQGAKGWELRVATSLAGLWRRQGKAERARELLAPVYAWFTEGFDTPDLRDARALLDELR